MVTETGAMWGGGAVSTCVRVRQFGAAGPGMTTRATIAGHIPSMCRHADDRCKWRLGAGGCRGQRRCRAWDGPGLTGEEGADPPHPRTVVQPEELHGRTGDGSPIQIHGHLKGGRG